MLLTLSLVRDAADNTTTYIYCALAGGADELGAY
jgi:hypothetical protein